jgi:hypothetical protein
MSTETVEVQSNRLADQLGDFFDAASNDADTR